MTSDHFGCPPIFFFLVVKEGVWRTSQLKTRRISRVQNKIFFFVSFCRALFPTYSPESNFEICLYCWDQSKLLVHLSKDKIGNFALVLQKNTLFHFSKKDQKRKRGCKTSQGKFQETTCTYANATGNGIWHLNLRTDVCDYFPREMSHLSISCC